MAESELPPLPVDIPWKRLCVSDEMIDMGGCDRRFPPRWQPSLAIFTYEPDQQVYDDMLVSYLKVTCTITGHTSEEISQVGNLLNYYYDSKVDEFVLDVAKQDACYGALLHVTVRPADATQARNKDLYPYFTDFQPKKREVYELVTQTGSSMSRSLEDVQVRKGTSTASNTEALDADKGIDWSTLGAIGGGAAGEAIGGPAGAVAGSYLGSKLGDLLGGGGDSAKPVNQAPETSIQTTDHSLEKREEYSHTTQLTQMYHQLTSYHLGTNRALFFIQPRPHIVQTVNTFVNGPRQLEGIQEFMLVVLRPKAVKQVCVDTRLELAYVYYEKGVIDQTDLWTFDEDHWPEQASYLGFVSQPLATAPNMQFKGVYTPPPGFEFNLDQYTTANDVVYSNPSNVKTTVTLNADKTQANITISVPAASATQVSPTGIAGSALFKANYPHTTVQIKFYLRKKGEEGQQIVDIPRRLFTLAYDLCCCPPAAISRIKVSVGYEGKFRTAVDAIPGAGMDIHRANRLGADIGRQLAASVNDPARYPYGAVGLAESQLLAEGVARHIDRADHPDNTPLAEIEGLRPEVRDRVQRVQRDLRRGDLLKMQLQELQDRFGLSLEDALHLRRASLRFEEPELPPEDRWEPRARRERREVPDLVGLSLLEAKRVLEDAGLRRGDVAYQDSGQPAGTVLAQAPAPGEAVRGETPISLTLATGLTVQIPDVVGLGLSEALCKLREAGLRSEPRLRFERGDHQDGPVVLEITPPARTFVTPHAQVNLRVSQP